MALFSMRVSMRTTSTCPRENHPPRAAPRSQSTGRLGHDGLPLAPLLLCCRVSTARRDTRRRMLQTQSAAAACVSAGMCGGFTISLPQRYTSSASPPLPVSSPVAPLSSSSASTSRRYSLSAKRSQSRVSRKLDARPAPFSHARPSTPHTCGRWSAPRAHCVPGRSAAARPGGSGWAARARSCR